MPLFFHKWPKHDGNVYLFPLTPDGPTQEFVGAEVIDQEDGPTIVITHAEGDGEVTGIFCGKEEKAAAEDLEQFLRDYFREGCVVEFTEDRENVCETAHGLVTGWDSDRFYVELDDPPEGLARGEISVCLNASNLLEGWTPDVIRISDGSAGEKAEIRAQAEAVAKIGRELLGGVTVQRWNELTGGGASCPLSWMDMSLPSPCPVCGATREEDTHGELPGPTLAEPHTPEDLGFEWQAEACNWVMDEPSELGRAYIESADAAWTERPEMTDGPVRVAVVVGSDLGDGQEHEAEIASLRFATVADALNAWEV